MANFSLAGKIWKLSHQHILLLIIYLLFLGFGVHQTSLQIAPAVMFVVLYPLVANFYQEAKNAFWLRFVIYFVVLIIGYSIGLGIARSISLPDAPKYIFLLLFDGNRYLSFTRYDFFQSVVNGIACHHTWDQYPFVSVYSLRIPSFYQWRTSRDFWCVQGLCFKNAIWSYQHV